MPQSESLVSKLREDAHLGYPFKPDSQADSVVALVAVAVVVDIEEIRLTKWTIPPSHITALGNCIDY